jgi:uncharacterized protein YbjT (DUF2867 family)
VNVAQASVALLGDVDLKERWTMPEQKTIAVVGATGAQGGGLVRAILADPERRFVARAITRDPSSEKARALAAAGAEVVAGDADEPASLEAAFAGAHGAFLVTNFWEHMSPEREIAQATALARATKAAGVEHVVWSTLEDTRTWVPLSDERLPTLHGQYKVPHFDAKGEADAVFVAEQVPVTWLKVAFYWENFIYFGQGPHAGPDGSLVLALPLGGGKLPGIAVGDVVFGIFTQGTRMVGETVGIAGETLSGPELAAGFAKHLGRPVAFYDMPFDDYRALGFPGADDMGNMYQWQAIAGEEFLGLRSADTARALNPELLTFDAWLAANAAQIPAE